MPSWQKELGSQIRQARETAGLTQAQLAKRAGLSRVTLNYYENAVPRRPSFEKILRIARVLRAEITIRGCTISAGPREQLPRSAPEQFCLEFEKEKLYSDVTLRIRPSKEGLLISTKANIV